MADADKKPLTPEQLQARIDQLEVDKQALQAQNAELVALPVDANAAAALKLKKGYKAPKGEEGYHHVLETQVNGETLAEPRVRAYDAHQYETLIAKQAGYTGEIIHKGKAE